MVLAMDRRRVPVAPPGREQSVAIETGGTEVRPAGAFTGGAPMPAQRLAQAVAHGRRRFLREIPGRLRRVVDAAALQDSKPPAGDEREAHLRRELHTLIGTAGTLGFLAIAEKASALHALLWTQGVRSDVDPATQHSVIQALVAAGLRARLSAIRPADAARRDPSAERILVLDDDEVQRSVIQASLELAGYRAAALEDPHALASALAAAPACLLVLDWDLGAQSGAGVLAQLRAEPATRELPVVVFSSHQQDDDVFAMFEAGARAFVSKLDTMQALIDCIDQQLDALRRD